jgi:DNA-binding NarL/FixJ family response regulator
MFSHALIIDPSPSDTKILKQRLKQLGIQTITTAGRITIGLEELSTNRKDAIDLIILDIDQPDAEDQTSVTRLKDSKFAKHVTLVVLTNQLDPAVMFNCLYAGADEFVSKEIFFGDKISSVLLMAYQRNKFRQ